MKRRGLKRRLQGTSRPHRVRLAVTPPMQHVQSGIHNGLVGVQSTLDVMAGNAKLGGETSDVRPAGKTLGHFGELQFRQTWLQKDGRHNVPAQVNDLVTFVPMRNNWV